MTRRHGLWIAAFAVSAGLAASSTAALAQDKLKLAVGQRGLWDTSVSEVGQRASIFKKHGLELEILWTQGAGETQQAVISGSLDTLQKRKAAVERYMAAYRETVDAMYSDPAVLKIYAEFAGISEAKAKRTRDDFFAKSAVNPDDIKGLDVIVPQAVTPKFTPAPLTKEQLAELIQIPPRKK